MGRIRGLLCVVVGVLCGCATGKGKSYDYTGAIDRARQSCAPLKKKDKLNTPVRTQIDRRMESALRAGETGQDDLAQSRAEQLAAACSQEVQTRADLVKLRRDVERVKNQMPPDTVSILHSRIRSGDYDGALLCAEAILRGQPAECRNARPPVTASAWTETDVSSKDARADVERSSEPPVRAHRVTLSVGFGLGSASLGGVHSSAEDVEVAIEDQHPTLDLDGPAQSSLQINWGAEVRYYLPYNLLAQLGFGTIYNGASSDFSAPGNPDGTLKNQNWGIELPLLFGGYYLFGDHLCLAGSLGPSFLVWSQSQWTSDPGGAPDFRADAAVGAHFVLGLDYVFGDRWALGVDFRYRYLKAGPLLDPETNEPLRSKELRGDTTIDTYDIDFSGFSGAFYMRVFVL
jgi:hypothetical protein